MSQPFEGIRVIDATHVLAGPFATYQLAVLGADVIKIDDPNELDTCRVAGSDPDLNRIGMGTMFLTQGSNKRSIALDLKTDEGRDTLRKLAATADVFIENYRPGAFDEIGLGYDDLSTINDQLIYGSFSAFGNTGERRPQRGYDHVIQASSGLMATTGTANLNPLKIGSPVVDYATGLAGAFAVASALFQRTHTGTGQYIDMAMMDVALLLMSSHITGFTLNGEHPEPSGNVSPGSATNNAFETKSGLLMLGAANRRQQRRLWQLLERDDLLDDDGVSTEERYRREAGALEQVMVTRTADEWEQHLQAHGIPAARVRTMSEALADPHVQNRRVLAEQNAPNVGSSFKVPVAAFGFGHNGPRVTSQPPTVGQHTAEILAELEQASPRIEPGPR